MFETLLKSALETGGEIFVYLKGFNNPFRGRVMDLDNDHFTLFQNGRHGTVLWAFRLPDVTSCGLLVGPPGEDPRHVLAGDGDRGGWNLPD